MSEIFYLLLIPVVFGIILCFYALTRPYSAHSYRGDGKYVGAVGLIISFVSVIFMILVGTGVIE